MSLERVAQWAVPGLDPDPGPLARLEAVQAAANTPSVVFQRLTDAENPETLREIAKAWKVPVGRFVQWYTTEHAELYEAALKVVADQDAHEVVQIADDAAPESVQVAKLRAEARKWRASKWDRDRYGEKVRVDQNVSVAVDAGLIGMAAALLEKVAGGVREKLVHGESEVLPAPQKKISVADEGPI